MPTRVCTLCKGERQLLEVRKLFAQGFKAEAISNELQLPKKVVEKWIKGIDFKRWRRRELLKLREIRNVLLESLLLLKEGKEPAINADQLLKYSRAYEKLFGRKSVVLYMQDSFDRLTDALVEEVQRAPTEYKRKRALFVLQNVRENMDAIVEQEVNKIVHE